MKKPPSGDRYRFRFRWTIDGPIETVFSYVSDARTFREWFHVFKEMSLDDAGAPVQVGSHTKCRVKALLPYVLDWDFTVAALDPPRLVETDCRVTLSGRFPLVGYVRYRLYEENGAVVVINEQELWSERRLPPVLHRLAHAAFSFNHDFAMARAQRPLQQVVRRTVSQAQDDGGKLQKANALGEDNPSATSS